MPPDNPKMPYRLTADIVAVCHFLFVLFAVFGGLSVLWRRKLMLVHVPAVLWAAYIEFSGHICPLTYVEIWLRQKGGGTGYENGFVEHYILPVLYPAELARSDQIILGILVILFNLSVYGYILYHTRISAHPKNSTAMNRYSENLHFPGNSFLKTLSGYWRTLPISAKFSCTFGLMLALILLLSLTGCLSLLFVRHKTETVIWNSTKLRELVLKMDMEMQNARRLEKEFFLYYPHIGFSEAFRIYGQESSAHIAEVVSLSAQLQKSPALSNINSSLPQTDVNLNFYLSAADRYSLVFLQALSLVEKLAGKGRLQDQLHQHAAMLEQSPEIQENPAMLAAYWKMRSFEKDYLITRQRSFMQAGFNTAAQLRKSAQHLNPEDSGNTEKQFLSCLDIYVRTAEEILQVDAEINSRIREFDLQTKAMAPVSEELISFSDQEMEHARNEISAIYRWMTGILAGAALAGLTLTLVIFRILDQSITRNILILTEAALHRGDTPMQVCISSGDELGHLARTFNDMSARLHALIHHLEHKVEERTAELRKEIRDRRHAEEEMKTAKEAAEKASRVKSEFLANLSHEIRTPMNSILGFADILGTMITDRQQKEYLESLHIGAQSLLRLINDILDLSKADAGKMEIQYAPVSLSRILTDTGRMFSHEMQRKKLDFFIETSPDLPKSLMLDKTRIRQILFNLLGNAVKFTDNGHIHLCAHTQPHDTGPDETPFVRLIITVKDTGIGIPVSDYEHIFEMFAQSRGKHSHGTGLGLTITRRLTEIMGGKIAVESRPGCGSVFTVTFDRVALGQEKESAEEKESLICETASELHTETGVCSLPDKTLQQSLVHGSELLDIIKRDLVPKWQELSETMFIDSIEDLAREAQKLGTEYAWPLLAAWAADLAERVSLFDIENLPGIMEKFPELVRDLEKQICGQTVS